MDLPFDVVLKSAVGGLLMWGHIYWHVVLAVVVVCVALVVIGRATSLSWLRSLALIPAAIAVAWIVYSITYSWHVYRYELTVDLDIDGETVSKSGIYEVRRAETPLRQYLLLGAPTAGQETVVRGEAIHFDLGRGNLLLVTMSGSNGPKNRQALSVLAQQILGVRDWKSPVMQEAMQRGTKKPVPPELLPWMITFDDPNDPDSLRVVDPDNLSEIFGRDVSVKSAWLQMTEERSDDFSLIQKLPWLDTIDRSFPAKKIGKRPWLSGNQPIFNAEVLANDGH
jgi:hypothetical protein